MARRLKSTVSRSLKEYILLPRETTSDSTIDKVSIKTPLVAKNSDLWLNIPIVSAAMQSVSGDKMGVELAKQGGVSFIFCSQDIKNQTSIIHKIKTHKAGFVVPLAVDENMKIYALDISRKAKEFSKFPVVDSLGKLVGLISKDDYDLDLHHNLSVKDRMIPIKDLEVGLNVFDLQTANDILLKSHQTILPIVDEQFRLESAVFRKDIYSNRDYPNEFVGVNNKLIAVASINTHDYEDRVPSVIDAGADAIAIDASDGHSKFQVKTLKWIKKSYPNIPVICGNIVTNEGFYYLVKSGADAIKVGMGGGSICITQEQKGVGRGLATALVEVVKARNYYLRQEGVYIPIIADGGINSSKDVIIALALGADYVMMGRWFARMEESPTEKTIVNGRVMKPYWGEGSKKAKSWRSNRYSQTVFDEGVEGFVEYAGPLKDNLAELISKIKAAMSSCGASDLEEFRKKARLEVMSQMSYLEGGVHHVYQTARDSQYLYESWGDK